MPTTELPVIPASSLLARAAAIKRDHELLGKLEAFTALANYARLFKDSGLTEGAVVLSEAHGAFNRYEIELEYNTALPTKADEAAVALFQELVDLREFADALTAGGAGEYFSEEIEFATFERVHVEPLREALVKAGVDLAA